MRFAPTFLFLLGFATTGAGCDDAADGSGGTGSGGSTSGGDALAKADGAITALATNGTDVVFLDWTSGDAHDALAVKKVPASGGAVTTLATETPVHTGFFSSGMTIDGDRVVYTVALASDDYELRAVPLAGGASSVVIAGLTDRAGFVLADATGLVWMDDAGGVSALPKGAMERVALGGSGCRGGISADAVAAYCFTTDGVLQRIPRDGSGATTLFNPGLPSFFKVSPLISRTVLAGDTLIAGVWSSMDGCHVFESTTAGVGKERSKDCMLQTTSDGAVAFGARDPILTSSGPVDVVRLEGASATTLGTSSDVRVMTVDATHVYVATDAKSGATIRALPRGD